MTMIARLVVKRPTTGGVLARFEPRPVRMLRRGNQQGHELSTIRGAIAVRQVRCQIHGGLDLPVKIYRTEYRIKVLDRPLVHGPLVVRKPQGADALAEVMDGGDVAVGECRILPEMVSPKPGTTRLHVRQGLRAGPQVTGID